MNITYTTSGLANLTVILHSRESGDYFIRANTRRQTIVVYDKFSTQTQEAIYLIGASVIIDPSDNLYNYLRSVLQNGLTTSMFTNLILVDRKIYDSAITSGMYMDVLM